MDYVDWIDNLGSGEVERLLQKIGQSLDFELKYAKVANREDLCIWWYETRWVDGKHLETSAVVCFPYDCGGVGDYAFSKSRRLLHAVLQTHVFTVNVHRDGNRWLECHFVVNPIFKIRSLEELEITLDLGGHGRQGEEL